MQINVHAVLSKYSLTPLKGINFEPVRCTTATPPHSLAISNVGEFPFTFRLFPLGDTPPAAAPARPDSKEKAKGGKGKGAAVPAGLQIGPFFVSPAEGEIDPGSSATVEVTFLSAVQGTFRSLVGIDVQHRAASDCPEGIPFELVAESCIPGIECSKVEGIFEEHILKKELDPFAPCNNEYGIADKVRIPTQQPSVYWAHGAWQLLTRHHCRCSTLVLLWRT